MSGMVHSLKVWGRSAPGRGGTTGLDEFVVGQPRLSIRAYHPHPATGPVELDRLAVESHLHPVATLEPFRGLEEKRRTFLDVSRQEIGQSTVRKRHIGPSVDDGDFGRFREATGPGGGGGATGDSPNDQDSFWIHIPSLVYIRFHM